MVPSSILVRRGAVEHGDVATAPREEDGLLAFIGVGVPGSDGGRDSVVSGGIRLDAVVGPVPGHGYFDVARSELVERPALGRIMLADVLVEHMDGVRVPVEQRLKPASCSDGAELAVVADHHCLGTGPLDCVQEAEQRTVVGHPSLVEYKDRPGIEGDGAPIKPRCK